MFDCTITNLKLFLDNATDVGQPSLVGACWGVFVIFSSLWKKVHKLYFSAIVICAMR